MGIKGQKMVSFALFHGPGSESLHLFCQVLFPALLVQTCIEIVELMQKCMKNGKIQTDRAWYLTLCQALV